MEPWSAVGALAWQWAAEVADVAVGADVAVVADVAVLTWYCSRALRPFPMPRGSGLGFSYRDRRRLDRSLFGFESSMITLY